MRAFEDAWETSDQFEGNGSVAVLIVVQVRDEAGTSGMEVDDQHRPITAGLEHPDGIRESVGRRAAKVDPYGVTRGREAGRARQDERCRRAWGLDTSGSGWRVRSERRGSDGGGRHTRNDDGREECPYRPRAPKNSNNLGGGSAWTKWSGRTSRQRRADHVAPGLRSADDTCRSDRRSTARRRTSRVR